MPVKLYQFWPSAIHVKLVQYSWQQTEHVYSREYTWTHILVERYQLWTSMTCANWFRNDSLFAGISEGTCIFIYTLEIYSSLVFCIGISGPPNKQFKHLACFCINCELQDMDLLIIYMVICIQCCITLEAKSEAVHLQPAIVAEALCLTGSCGRIPESLGKF